MKCPMYWEDHNLTCQRQEGHEPPHIFRGPSGAHFVSARVYREALALISPLGVGQYKDSGDRARKLLEELDKL